MEFSKDMEEIHAAIGLPLKATYTSIQTDPQILKKLGKENEAEPTYSFLGISWNLRKNSILPLTTYRNLSSTNVKNSIGNTVHYDCYQPGNNQEWEFN